MTDDDVKSGSLVWDETDLGCGKGKLSRPELSWALADDQPYIRNVSGIGQSAWYVFRPHHIKPVTTI